MPILNAFLSVWDTAMLSVPLDPTHDSSGVDAWNAWMAPAKFIVNSFSVKEVSTLDFDTSVAKGAPTGSMWSVGDTVWQVDFSIPFLVWDPLYFSRNGISHTSFQSPAFANMPVVGGYAYPTKGFILAAKRYLLGSERINRPLWDEHWVNSISTKPDFLVQRVSIEVSDNRSMLSVSLLSTTDPRHYFNTLQTPMVVSPGPTRVARPWDFSIPSDIQVLGSPLTAYSHGYQSIPTRTATTSIPKNVSFVTEWSVNIESQITRFRSVGTPSGRPMFGVTSQQCSGRLKYLPLHVSSLWSTSIVDSGDLSSALPTGWRTDSQSMEMIQRYGGQLFVSGHPSYLVNGYRPVFPEIGLRYGSNPLLYYIISRDMLGPVGAATVGFEAAAGGTNAVVVDYKTLLGKDDAEAEFFNALTSS